MLNESRLQESMKGVRGLSEADPPRTVRLNAALRRVVNQDLDRALNRKYVPSVGAGVGKIVEILNRHGLEEMDPFVDVGRRPYSRYRIAKRNPADPFSPIEIVNSMLIVNQGQAGDRGNFEVMAYLS